MPLEGLLGPKREGRPSAPFTFTNSGNVLTGAVAMFDLQEGIGDFSCNAPVKEYQRFMPFQKVSILNNDVDNPISFEPNNEPAHAIEVLNRAIQDLEKAALLRWKITNKGSGTISTRKIVITLWNE